LPIYVGGYTNDLPVTLAGVRLPEHRVGSWITLDLGVVYSSAVETTWLRGVRLGFNVNNILDRDPPIVFSGNTAFNASKPSPFEGVAKGSATGFLLRSGLIYFNKIMWLKI